jgi:diacylglycerol kinase (ATP)
MPQTLRIIINPASGQDAPVLNVINRVFHPSGVDWDVAITRHDGDGMRLAQQAVADGVDMVGVYGGDGTVMEVGCGLVGTDTPMAILPGGTANVMSVEMGIPTDLAVAAALMVGDHEVHRIDVGQINDRFFLLRAGLGLEAAMIEGAGRELKDRMGILAYGVSAVQALREPQFATYQLTLDGEQVEATGVACIIANVGSIGQGSLSIAPNIRVNDGMLDVIVIQRADFAALVTLATTVLRGDVEAEPLLHWQAQEITLISDPPQTIQVDGELLEAGPIHARVLNAALSVVVPMSAVVPEPHLATPS